MRPSTGPFELRLRGEDEGLLATCRVVQLPGVDAKHQLTSPAYWVLPVDKNVLSGHGGTPSENGIFSPTMSDLMAGIISQVSAVRRDAPVVPLSNPGQTPSTDAPKPSGFPLRLVIP